MSVDGSVAVTMLACEADTDIHALTLVRVLLFGHDCPRTEIGSA